METARSKIRKFFEENDYNLDKRLPDGLPMKISKKYGIPYLTVTSEICVLKGTKPSSSAQYRPKKKKKKSATERVEKYITDCGYDITKQLASGTHLKISKKLKIPINTVRTCLCRIKKRKNIVVHPLKVRPKITINNKEGEKILKQHTDRLNPNKQFTESLFLNIAQSYLGPKSCECLSVTGPDYNRHVNKLMGTIATHVHIVERDKLVFKQIYKEASKCKYYINDNVSLINGDVEKIIIPDCRFIDLDLMASLHTIFPIIMNQKRTQSLTCKKDSIKCITFTASCRADGGKTKRFENIKSLLDFGFGCKLTGFQGQGLMGTPIQFEHLDAHQLSTCHKHIPLFEDMGSVIDLQVIQYQDGSPMISILIVYK